MNLGVLPDIEEARGTSARSAESTLVELEATELEMPRPAPFGTGFSPLDDVLNGGICAGDLLVIGGKPGQGKTIAVLQWARSMARTGHTAVFACYEHDEVALVTRLLACELGEAIADAEIMDPIRLDGLRAGLRAVSSGRAAVREVLDSDPLMREAEERFVAYASNLILLRASGTRTDVTALTHLIEVHRGDRTALFVDYLQKVPVIPEPADESERVKRVTEALKELALGSKIAITAVAAADRLGLVSKRLRLHHMRGSTALAYEADAAVILNEKIAVVAKAHLAYDSTRAAEFRRQVIFSVEKNRNGPSDIDLEFEKDFANYRFSPAGGWVVERLWHEGTVEE